MRYAVLRHITQHYTTPKLRGTRERANFSPGRVRTNIINYAVAYFRLQCSCVHVYYTCIFSLRFISMHIMLFGMRIKHTHIQNNYHILDHPHPPTFYLVHPRTHSETTRQRARNDSKRTRQTKVMRPKHCSHMHTHTFTHKWHRRRDASAARLLLVYKSTT